MLLLKSLESKRNRSLLFGFSTTASEFTHSVGSETFSMSLIRSSRLSSYLTLFFIANGIFLGGCTTGFASFSNWILYSVDKHPNPKISVALFLTVSNSTGTYMSLVDTRRVNFPTVSKSNREALNRNWCNQKANPALKTKTGNK